MVKKTFKLSGMHCASCAASIEQAVKKIPGISAANVNFVNENLYAEFDEKLATVEKIIEAVKKAGFNAEIFQDEKEKPSESEILKKRFAISLILGLPVIYMAASPLIGLPTPHLGMKTIAIIQLAISTAIISLNPSLYAAGLRGLINRNQNINSQNINSPVEIGTAAAYFYSLVISFLVWFSPGFSMEHLYFESAVIILIFVSLGKYLEAAAKEKTGEAIKKLIGLQPKTATVIVNGLQKTISASEVKVGDLVFVRPGQKFPVDGIVSEGLSSVDEKAITGENMPVVKKPGDAVIGATTNKIGALTVRTTKVGKDTALAQIIATVREAMGSKAPIQLIVDKAACYFVPGILAIAILAFAVWLVLGKSFAFAFTAFISVLIIACPCALALAAPTAVMAGSGLAAKRGILVKNGEALEIASQVDTVIFSKTGTLTVGGPKVSDIIAAKFPDKVLKLAAAMEINSKHPLASAIVLKAKQKKLEIPKIKEFIAIPGKGISAIFRGKPLLFGSKKLLTGRKISLVDFSQKISELENQGKTVMILAYDGHAAGLIAVTDFLKKNSKDAVLALKKMGKTVVMISGNNKNAAIAIAKNAGIENVFAEVLPREKAGIIKKFQEQGHIVAMVGNGINDAPALTQADLGIALGSGTDIAIETGDLVLIKDNLNDVVEAIKLSVFILKKIKQNLFWAFFYNALGTPVAAGILYPFTGWLLNPMLAAAAMSFSSVSVVLNSLSIKNYKG
jgi:Cu+-exporting ATPase